MDIVFIASEVREWLRTFKPENPVEATAYLEVLSAFKEEVIEKRIKADCYSVLNQTVPDGEFEFNGIRIKHVLQTQTVYNKTGEVTIAEAAFKQAKENLENARRAAGFTTVKGNEYWQIVKKEAPAAEE